jgi:hypothetical protein
LFVDICKRLGGNEFDAFNKLVIEKSEQLKSHQSKVKHKPKLGQDNEGDNLSEGRIKCGTLKVDATVADQQIKFPTDVDLLNTSREKLERITDLL